MHSERAPRESEARFRALTELSSDLYWEIPSVLPDEEGWRAQACDAFQGYVFCKPQPAQAIGELLAAHRREHLSALR